MLDRVEASIPRRQALYCSPFRAYNNAGVIASGLRVNNKRWNPGRDKKLSYFPQRPDRLWVQPALLYG